MNMPMNMHMSWGRRAAAAAAGLVARGRRFGGAGGRKGSSSLGQTEMPVQGLGGDEAGVGVKHGAIDGLGLGRGGREVEKKEARVGDGSGTDGPGLVRREGGDEVRKREEARVGNAHGTTGRAFVTPLKGEREIEKGTRHAEMAGLHRE